MIQPVGGEGLASRGLGLSTIPGGQSREHPSRHTPDAAVHTMAAGRAEGQQLGVLVGIPLVSKLLGYKAGCHRRVPLVSHARSSKAASFEWSCVHSK